MAAATAATAAILFDNSRARPRDICPPLDVGMRVTTSDRFEAKMLVEKLGQVRTMMSKTMEQIEKISSSMQENKPLQSIPGFGPYIEVQIDSFHALLLFFAIFQIFIIICVAITLELIGSMKRS